MVSPAYSALCRNMLKRGAGAQTWTLSCLVFALTIAGSGDEAMAASVPLLTASDGNPAVKSMALMAYGFAHTATDPTHAYEVQRRGLEIARNSGNGEAVTLHSTNLSRLASTHGEPADALDYLSLAIHHQYDSGRFSFMRNPLAILAVFFDRLGYLEQAATIAGFAADPFTLVANPEINAAMAHLRAVLGDTAYESLACTGADMTNAAIVAYALAQIDRTRAELQ